MLNSQFKSGIGLRLEMNDYIYIYNKMSYTAICAINK